METLETTKKFDELVIVKVRTSTLIDKSCMDWLALDEHSFNNIGKQVTALSDKGMAVAIVSSGAIATGYAYSHEKRTHETRQDTIEKQRMACLGQTTLMSYWQNALKSKLVGQLLFTKRELESPEGVELRTVTTRLFERGDIAIANENDALSHEEISFGDNDTLAARFAILLHKSGLFKRTRLIILSDIDGVYEDINDHHTVITTIDDTGKYQHIARGTGSANGTGGMASKFKAAKIATEHGVEMYIANGCTEWAIERALNGKIGTHFTAKTN